MCSHMDRVGTGPGSQTPRRCVRKLNVHFLLNRSARTHRRSPVNGSASIHLISMRRDPFDELTQVGRQRHFPPQPFARAWMIEPEQLGVQGQARRSAVILNAGCRRGECGKPDRRKPGNPAPTGECESGAFAPSPAGK